MSEGSYASRAELRAVLNGVRQAQGLIGSAPAYLEALEQLARFAAVDLPILIAGETGTGKELAARAIHYLSVRSAGPFIPINCGALPERLFENELFGHARGAFTDARHAQIGLIGQGEGGTLLLDEIDCLDPHSQAALLRFLQDRTYRPLGGGNLRTADVRIIASTNVRLKTIVEDRGFRSDLLFRLDVGRVELPPLRERRSDIMPLARHFLQSAAKRHNLTVPIIGAALERRLLEYPWPGNVRELENAMHRGLLLAGGDQQLSDSLRLGSITTTATPPEEEEQAMFFGTLKTERARRTEAFEREYLTWLLDRTHGNISAASVEAGTERRHLGRLIQRHGIKVEEFRRR
jgi:DNA-binding NtrC family response regulator